ncbi:MAG: hypothetical protein GX959_01015 [Clostridiales bacterium]|jgi:hypothetical protein|nr:hypothetical protein [Clostridiales bacterium]
MENKSFLAKLVDNKKIVIGSMIFALIYALIYGIGLSYAVGGNPITHTISMIGRSTILGRFPTLFVFFGIVTNISLLLNINYAYNREGFINTKAGKIGNICAYIGVLCLTICTLIPSIEFDEVVDVKTTFQVIGHWSGALLFGVFFAISICIYLLMERKKYKYFLTTFIAFVTLLAGLVISIFFLPNNKNGLVEIVPICLAMLIMIFVNADVYPKLSPPTETDNN